MGEPRPPRSREVAERVCRQIVGFSGFGFPKAHSAAFGLLAYQSTWLRVHYSPEFLCALLNEQPMGFYPPDALVHEAQRRKSVLPPDPVLDVACWRRASPPSAHRGRRGADRPRLRDWGAGRGHPRGRGAGGVGCTARAATWPRCSGVGGMRWPSSPGPGRAMSSPRGGGRKAAGAMAARRGPCRVDGGAAGAPARSHAAPPAARAVALGSDARRLRLHRDHPPRASAPAPAPGPRTFATSSEDLSRRRTAERVRVAGLVVARQRPATAKG